MLLMTALPRYSTEDVSMLNPQSNGHEATQELNDGSSNVVQVFPQSVLTRDCDSLPAGTNSRFGCSASVTNRELVPHRAIEIHAVPPSRDSRQAVWPTEQTSASSAA